MKSLIKFPVGYIDFELPNCYCPYCGEEFTEVGLLKKLVDKKKELQSAELLNAIEKSKRSYEEILIFLNGGK